MMRLLNYILLYYYIYYIYYLLYIYYFYFVTLKKNLSCLSENFMFVMYENGFNFLMIRLILRLSLNEVHCLSDK